MSKSVKSALVIFILVVAAVALYLGYSALKAKNDAAAETTGEAAEKLIPVTDFLPEDATHITYGTEDDVLSFEKNDEGAWRLSDEPGYPVNSGIVENMIDAVSGISAKREIDRDDDEAFGFAPASLSVTVTYKDGTKLSLDFGNENSYDGCVYLKDVTNTKNYLVDKSLKDVFDYTKETLMVTDTFPEIDNTKLNSMTVCDETGKVNVVTDATGLSDSASIFERMSFSSDGAEYCTPEERKARGITEDSAYAELSYKKKNTVSNDDGTMSEVWSDETLKLVFGDVVTKASTDEDGNETLTTSYYYSTPDSTVVYLASEASYEELMRYAAYTPAESESASESE